MAPDGGIALIAVVMRVQGFCVSGTPAVAPEVRPIRYGRWRRKVALVIA